MQDRVRFGNLELSQLRVEADILGADLGQLTDQLLALEVTEFLVELRPRRGNSSSALSSGDCTLLKDVQWR